MSFYDARGALRAAKNALESILPLKDPRRDSPLGRIHGEICSLLDNLDLLCMLDREIFARNYAIDITIACCLFLDDKSEARTEFLRIEKHYEREIKEVCYRVLA
jgi:hypothetical protein